MQLRYIDHTSCDKKDLGMFYNTVSFEGEVISTCHRIEVITDIPLPNFEMKGYKSKQVRGDKEVCLRLARIAAGVESVILGEPFILDQVRNSFKEPHPLIQKSIDIAERVRNEFDFYSLYDYSDIAIEFLKPISDVVIIGSGMLAEAISKKLHGNVTIVTRSLKSAKKKFKNVCKINNLPDSFKCIIATTSSLKYRKDVCKFIDRANCYLVIDLSSDPFDELKCKYISMYDEVFEKEIEMANDKIKFKVPLVEKMIKEMICL